MSKTVTLDFPITVADRTITSLDFRRPVVDELNIGFNPGQLRRCPGCGGMVYLWPCLACGCRAAARD